jgi:hypothetical protein
MVKLIFAGKIPDIRQAYLEAVPSLHIKIFLEMASQGRM